jgi:peptidoglycan/LPS O-acetylase OafA/YrhL
VFGPVADILLCGALAYAAALVAAHGLARLGFPVPAGGEPCIDGLRGLLALAVLVHHFAVWIPVARAGAAWATPASLPLHNLGAGSVGLFFMVTGYVFYPRVLGGLRGLDLGRLALGRLFRLYPALLASILMILGLILWRTGGADARPLHEEAAALLRWLACAGTPPLLGEAESGRINAHVLWSLRYELLFYILVLPACCAAMDRLRGRAPSWWVPAGLLVGALLLRPLKNLLPLIGYLPLFAMGMLAYEVRMREALAARLRGPVAAALAAAALVLAATTQVVPGKPAALALYGAFFLCVACGNGIGGLLRLPGARLLGACSYGVYLLHGLVLSALFVDLAPLTAGIPTGLLPLLIPAAAVAAVLLAALVHVAVERPGIRAGQALAQAWDRAPALGRLRPRAA